MAQIPTEYGQISQEQLAAQRANYTNVPGPVMGAFYAVGAKGKYAKMPQLFDISHWNAMIVNGVKVPVTDFKYWASFPQWYFGVYIKCGEAYGNLTWRDKGSDFWYDVLCDQHVTGAYGTGSWIGLYEMYEPAWYENRGISMDGVKKMFEGATNDIIAVQLLDDPNIAIFVRKTVMGIGRDMTAERMKNLPKSPAVDALIIDLEKWYTSSGKAVDDLHMAFALRNTIDGLRWLMAHGYLKTLPIIIYTSDWFLRTYGNVYTRQVCDENICIDAGYYWNQNVLGTKPVTFEQLMADLATIPDAWHPAYVGEEVFALQVSGDYFKMFNSAQDINCVKLTWAELEARFPAWKVRRDAYYGGTTPEPPVDPPPVVVPKTGKVVSAAGVRIRSKPTMSAVYFGVLPKDYLVDIEDIALTGNERWVRIARDLWCCAKQGTTTLIDLK